eukprot:859970_1
MRNFFVYLVILIAVLSMSAAGEKGTARNLLRVRGNMKKGKDKQCHQECKESKQCPQDKCSICREGQHSWKQCLPVCGEECKDKDDCPAECKECKGGVCSRKANNVLKTNVAYAGKDNIAGSNVSLSVERNVRIKTIVQQSARNVKEGFVLSQTHTVSWV